MKKIEDKKCKVSKQFKDITNENQENTEGFKFLDDYKQTTPVTWLSIF